MNEAPKKPPAVDDDVPAFTKALQEYRRKHPQPDGKPMTIEELCVRTGRRWMTVYRWLNGGHTNPDTEAMVRAKLKI